MNTKQQQFVRGRMRSIPNATKAAIPIAYADNGPFLLAAFDPHSKSGRGHWCGNRSM